MAKLSGKVALITGAARGQGRSHAVRLAEDGADIVAVDIVAQIPTAYYPPATPADLQLTAKLAEGEGARVLTAAMIARGEGGAVVLTSSLAGLHGYRNIASYVAAKHGVNGLMRTLANELGPYNIRVNSVCPGLINTDMMMNDETYAMFRPDLADPTLADAREVFRKMQLLPIDWLEPRDVSNAIAFLVSDEARAITGVALPVDGGQLTRG
jgi:NAD(P)-dependent dehydrogenase (short-subunit alcohol dehydrogenase family)